MKNIMTVIIALSFLFTGTALAQDVQQEEITLTTYYPAPYGDYDEITADEITADEITADAITADTITAAGVTIGSGTVSGNLVVEGNVGIGTTAPQAKLDVSATTSGFLPPRMTTDQRTAIDSPPNGSILYNTTSNEFNFREGGSWQSLGGGGGCYVSYSGSCLSGFTNKGSAGSWGWCTGYGSITQFAYFLPPGASCGPGAGTMQTHITGTAWVCCQ